MTESVEEIARRLTRQLGALVVRCLPEAWEVDVTTDAAVEASEAYALVLAALAAERQRAEEKEATYLSLRARYVEAESRVRELLAFVGSPGDPTYDLLLKENETLLVRLKVAEHERDEARTAAATWERCAAERGEGWLKEHRQDAQALAQALAERDAARAHREAAWHAAQSYFIRALRDRASTLAAPSWDAAADYLNTLDEPGGRMRRRSTTSEDG